MQHLGGSPTELLYSSRLRNELNHLLWIRPFSNRGTPDYGWNCRDHAFIAGIVAQLLGLTVEVVHGESLYVRGATESDYGLGVHQRTHTWLAIEGDGLMDISIRLSATDPVWQHPQIEYVAAGQCQPTGHLHAAETQDAFDSVVLDARSLEGEHAIYRAEKVNPIDRRMAHNAFAEINSPLTVNLSRQYPPTLYAKLAVHAFELLQGKAATLTTLQADYAWKKLSRLPDNAIEWLVANGGLR